MPYLIHEAKSSCSTVRELASGRFLFVSSCLAATLLASNLAELRRPDSLVKPLESIGLQISGWSLAGQQAVPPRVLDKLAPSSYTARTYTRNDRQLGLFIAYYDQQRAGETMHSPKVCLPGGGWEIAQQGFTTISVDGQPVKLNQYHIQNAGRRMLVLYWYQSRGRIIASEYLGKLFLIRDAILMGSTSGSIVRITLPDDLMSAEEAADFAKELIPQVQRCLSE